MAGLGPDEMPSVEERLAAVEELAMAAIRNDPRGRYVAEMARAAVDAAYDGARAINSDGKARRMAGVRAALKRLAGA